MFAIGNCTNSQPTIYIDRPCCYRSTSMENRKKIKNGVMVPHEINKKSLRIGRKGELKSSFEEWVNIEMKRADIFDVQSRFMYFGLFYSYVVSKCAKKNKKKKNNNLTSLTYNFMCACVKFWMNTTSKGSTKVQHFDQNEW